jgi:hypothetical protein
MAMMVWDIGSYNMLQRLQQNVQWLMELQLLVLAAQITVGL